METETIKEEKPALLDTRWFKSERITFAGAGSVDAEAGVIHDVILCQVGQAKGHGIHLEQSFIEEGIAYAQKHHKKLGMKCRFGHPAMSNDALGTEMGRFKNFRVVDDKMVADLHLLKSADLSPSHPGMRSWMLGMAQEDPNAIMCSIVFTIDEYYQYDSNGKKIRVYYYDKDDEWISANTKMKVYVSLKELYFCDIVDEGAATEKLFSADLNKDKFAVIATEFLNEHPQIDQFIKENPEKLMAFLGQRFGIKLEDKVSFADRVKKVVKEFFGEKPLATKEDEADASEEEVPADAEKDTDPSGRLNHENDFSTNKDKDGMDFKRSLALLSKEGGALTAEELAEVVAEITAFTGANERFTKAEVDAQVQAAVQEKETELNKTVSEKDKEIEALGAKVAKLEVKPAGDQKKPVVTGEEELHEEKEDQYETSVDRELAAMRKKAGIK